MSNSYAVSSRSAAAPDAVYALLVRAATWPSWSPITEAEVEGAADADVPQAVGDIRVFRTGRALSRERILDLEPDRRFVYDNVGGGVFRFYRGTVELAARADGGTDISWSGVFTPKLPLTGWFWSWYLGRFMRRMADGLAAYAGRRNSRGEDVSG